MPKLVRLLLISLLGLALVLGMASCSGSSNNDQGTSFLALGYYQPEDPDDRTTVVGLTGLFANLNSDNPSQGLSGTVGGALPFEARALFAFIGLENRLQFQFIRTTRFDCSYDIQGAQVAIPDDSFNLSTVLGGNPDDDEVGASADEEVRPREVFVEVAVVQPDIFSFLNNNINLLPQLPFTMTATCRALGVTEAGDVLETNPISLPIFFGDNPECCTGQDFQNGGSFQQGTGSGGTLTSFSAGTTGSSSLAESEEAALNEAELDEDFEF